MEGLGDGITEGLKDGIGVEGKFVGLGEGNRVGTIGSLVGLGEGINEGLREGTGVVGKLVGLGVGEWEGIGLGDGDGMNEGLSDGKGVVGYFVGRVVGEGVGAHESQNIPIHFCEGVILPGL